jgi:hypothetical protein
VDVGQEQDLVRSVLHPDLVRSSPPPSLSLLLLLLLLLGLPTLSFTDAPRPFSLYST